MITTMRPYQDPYVRAIYTACHPGWPPRAMRWFEAHPTLVAIEGTEVVGYTSYSLVMQPEVSKDGEVMIGYGIDIKPGHHGKGWGRRLCDARLEVARAVGATTFVGHAAPENLAMIRLFEKDGFKPVQLVPDGYPDGPMAIYMGPVR